MSYKSKIANATLQTPFDDKSAPPPEMPQATTPTDFYRHCYYPPRFRRLEELKHLASDDYEVDNESRAFVQSYEDFLDMILRQKTEYENFLNWLRNFDMGSPNNSKIYTISGNAGTGKTTLVNYLSYYCKEIEWVILDCFNAKELIGWFGDTVTTVPHFEKPFAKVFAIIVSTIRNIFFVKPLESKDGVTLPRDPYKAIYKYIKQISTNYNKYALRYPIAWERCGLLREIYLVVNTELDVKACVTKVSSFCAEHFSNYFQNDSQEDSQDDFQNKLKKAYQSALNDLLFVLRSEPGGFDKKYAIVFDNIERFIGQDEIFNEDANIIRKSLQSFSSHINRYVSPIYNKMYSPHVGSFKFIMAVRTSTRRMIKVTRHAADGGANDMNIEKWYDSDGLIKRRMEWYSNESGENPPILYECQLVNQIIGDYRRTKDGSVTGLKPQIDALFNNDKRLIVEYIGMIVESNRNQAAIAKYQELWAENTKDSRYAARSIMWGLILYSLERSSLDNNSQDLLFSHLYTYSKSPNENGLGDARKILTILFNHPAEQDKGVKLSELLGMLFDNNDIHDYWRKYCLSTAQIKCDTLSEILYYMNAYNARANNWIQFVDIQMSRKNASTVTIEKPEDLKKLITDHMNQIDVHLMPAGECYLFHIAASFEFFAMRYYGGGDNKYEPLFSLIPTPQDMMNTSDVKKLKCYQVLYKTCTSAKNCINIINAYGDDDFPLHIKINDVRSHADRIKHQHLSYIGTFQHYIRSHYIDNSAWNNHIGAMIKKRYEELLTAIESLRKLYTTN